MKTILSMISFYSNGWMQQCFRSLKKYLPEQEVMVLDNNFLPGESGHSCAYRGSSYLNEYHWSNGAERDFLLDQGATLVPSRKGGTILRHGLCMDLIVQWSQTQGYDILVYIEPDSIITGRKWFDDLVQAIESGAYMASCSDADFYLHIVPSAWKLSELYTSFVVRSKTSEEQAEAANFLFGVQTKKNFHTNFYDVGVYAWYQFNQIGKAKYVPSQDFEHLYKGSITDPIPLL